jgi:hypothetical protein
MAASDVLAAFEALSVDDKWWMAEKIMGILKGPSPPEHTPASNPRTEVQAHGFTWEQQLIMNVYKATPEQLKGVNYTSKMDLPSKCNNLDHVDVSIKTTGKLSSVCMADCLRVFDSVNNDTPIHLTVIHYSQDDVTNTKKVVSIIEVDLTNSRDLLFGTLTRDQVVDLDRLIKSVPQKRSPTEEEYTKMYTMRNTLQQLSGAIHLDIKCNSQQSRLQCSFNHFDKFIKENPKRIVAKSDTSDFRGGSISLEIQSSRRVFKK